MSLQLKCILNKEKFALRHLDSLYISQIKKFQYIYILSKVNGSHLTLFPKLIKKKTRKPRINVSGAMSFDWDLWNGKENMAYQNLSENHQVTIGFWTKILWCNRIIVGFSVYQCMCKESWIILYNKQSSIRGDNLIQYIIISFSDSFSLFTLTIPNGLC